MLTATARAAATAIFRSLRPLGSTPAFGRVECRFRGGLDDQAEAWSYLNGKDNSNSKSNSNIQVVSPFGLHSGLRQSGMPLLRGS